MLVLIDESGDPGFKLAKGSTPYFVVAMVLFQDLDQAERASIAIGQGSGVIAGEAGIQIQQVLRFGAGCFFRGGPAIRFWSVGAGG